jgi:hypothetical protein
VRQIQTEISRKIFERIAFSPASYLVKDASVYENKTPSASNLAAVRGAAARRSANPIHVHDQ